MSADLLLSRLDGVRQRGASSWSAKCPAHDDRSPSLSVKEVADGRVLVHCFGGCAVDQVLAAVGLELDALFPPRPARPGGGGKPSKLRLPAAQALEVLSREALLIFVIGSDINQKKSISATDFDRLATAVRRVGQIVEATR